jgi:hypothetical protein
MAGGPMFKIGSGLDNARQFPFFCLHMSTFPKVGECPVREIVYIFLWGRKKVFG